MASTELFILGIVRAVVEVALLSLLGQGLVGLLAGARRHSNPIYQLFRIVTGPVIKAARWIAPAAILDRHLPLVAFFILFWFWIFLAWAKRFLAA
jgi:hypothetical protein